MRIQALSPLIPSLCLVASCASALPEFGSNAPVRHTAEAPAPAQVARVLVEDPFADMPPAPRMMHHGVYVSPVPGTDIINDEAFPNEDASQGMGGRRTTPPGADSAHAPATSGGSATIVEQESEPAQGSGEAQDGDEAHGSHGSHKSHDALRSRP